MIISYTQMPTYEPAGQDLGIYWNEQFIEPEGEESHWVYDYCLAKTTDNYACTRVKADSQQVFSGC
jgi:hypothetical protein